MRAARQERWADRPRESAAGPLVAHALRSPSRAPDGDVQAALAPRLGHDLARLRIHDGPVAAAASRALGARGFTVGAHIVLGATSSTATARRVLAHEAVHSVQQGFAAVPTAGLRLARNARAEREAQAVAASVEHGNATPSSAPVHERVAPSLQCDLESPERMAGMHDDLFVSAPGSSGGALQPWQDAHGSNPGTAGAIITQARQTVRTLVRDHPESVRGTIPRNTTEAALDADALTIDGRIRARFPMIAAAASPDAVTNAVRVMGPGLTGDQDYLRQWLANKLIGWTDIAQYAIAESDPRFVAMLDAILADPDIGADLRILASRVAGFQRGDSTQREIFVHHGTSIDTRRVVLIHELVHFRAHPHYVEWVQSTTDSRFYNEGYTEWLAQRVMTDAERGTRGSYADRVRAIERQVAAHVSEDDMARAFFAGEVWRIETRSTIARREFAAASGMATDATGRAEASASRSSRGLTQEVARGAHYRFLNLGHDEVEPKPEHATFFREVKVRHLDPSPDTRLKFVGHASTPGSAAHNRDLSRRRALAFYQLARREGVPESRLIDASRPEHLGESRPTLTEEDVQTRAFNRRVELFLRTGPEAAR